MTTTYHNLDELLQGETPYAWGRALYKYTDCGSWTSYLVADQPARTERFAIEIRETPTGLVAKSMTSHPAIDALRFLGFEDDGSNKLRWHSRKALHKRIDAFFRKERTPDKAMPWTLDRNALCIGCLRVELSRNVPATIKTVYYEDDAANVAHLPDCIGIRIGSSVEGSDVELDPIELLFPFTECELDAAVKGINEEAAFYWDRDNSTYYTVRDKNGNMVCWAQWREFDDAPIVDDAKKKALAKRAYEALFPSTENSWSMAPGREAPIPHSRYVARLEETPDMVF